MSNMRKTVKQVKKEVNDKNESDRVEPVIMDNLGVGMFKSNDGWKVAILRFNSDGKAEVASVHGEKGDDRATAVERFKILAVTEGVI